MKVTSSNEFSYCHVYNRSLQFRMTNGLVSKSSGPKFRVALPQRLRRPEGYAIHNWNFHLSLQLCFREKSRSSSSRKSLLFSMLRALSSFWATGELSKRLHPFWYSDQPSPKNPVCGRPGNIWFPSLQGIPSPRPCVARPWNVVKTPVGGREGWMCVLTGRLEAPLSWRNRQTLSSRLPGIFGRLDRNLFEQMFQLIPLSIQRAWRLYVFSCLQILRQPSNVNFTSGLSVGDSRPTIWCAHLIPYNAVLMHPLFRFMKKRWFR